MLVLTAGTIGDMDMSKRDRERFFSKLGPLTPNGCREWTAYRDKHGYGKFGMPDRSIWYAPRVAWMLAHPDKELPRVVRHTCDNPPCAEATHLVAGTHKQNTADMMERGRHRILRGVDAPGALLTRELAQEIIDDRRQGLSYPAIAAKREVPAYTVTNLCLGNIYRSFNLDLPPSRTRWTGHVKGGE